MRFVVRFADSVSFLPRCRLPRCQLRPRWEPTPQRMVDLSRRKGEQMPWAQTLSTRLRLLHRRQALRILNQTGG